MMRISLNLMLLIKPEEVWLGNKWLLGEDHEMTREEQDKLTTAEIEHLAKDLENLYSTQCEARLILRQKI